MHRDPEGGAAQARGRGGALRGKPVAIVQPAPGPGSGKRLGMLKGSMKIRRDLVRTSSSADWEMLR